MPEDPCWLVSFLVQVYALHVVGQNLQYKYLSFSDIVFFIFLYQRYIYRIDPKRVNEFGTSQDMLDPNGDIMPEQSEAIESSPSEAIESSQSEVKEPSQTEEEKTEQKDSNGEAHPPKSADDKKND